MEPLDSGATIKKKLDEVDGVYPAGKRIPDVYLLVISLARFGGSVQRCF
jgi:hypothetical protein